MIDRYVQSESTTAAWLQLCANESDPMDRRCACGSLIVDQWADECEDCEREDEVQP